jgi:hypothetical protein
MFLDEIHFIIVIYDFDDELEKFFCANHLLNQYKVINENDNTTLTIER